MATGWRREAVRPGDLLHMGQHATPSVGPIAVRALPRVS
jgi:hypothetical protein